ncbi:MAG: hypothetical protein FWE40_05470 [Oscillospiraceae bacterium]|nr:hypothetical protein [Oscillospiraceae bacterium]
MNIIIGEKEFELRTGLGTVKLIEGRAKKPLLHLLDELENAMVDELLALLYMGLGGKTQAETAGLAQAADDDLDFMGLFIMVQKFIGCLMFTGTPAQQEKKIADMEVSEKEKNGFRQLLGLPLVEIPNEPLTFEDASTPTQPS